MKRTARGPGWFIALACIAALSLVAACGGDTDSDSSRGDTLAGQGFTEQQGDGDEFAPASGAPSGLAGGTAAQDAGSSSSSGAAPLPRLLDRKLIRTATLQIEAGAVSQKFEDVANIAVSSGGLVFSSTFGNDGERQTASVTIRVPNERYEEVLAQLRRLGDVRSEQSNATDVTEEFTDLQSNLNNLHATEREYLKLLAQARTIDEILTVQDRINATRAQIEQVQGRLNLLGNQTDLATITVHLTPLVAQPVTEDNGASGPLEVADEAFEASLAVLLGIAVVAVAIAAFSWWLLPLAALGIYLGRRQIKQDRTRHQPPPAAPAP
jgi:hypothetical protein